MGSTLASLDANRDSHGGVAQNLCGLISGTTSRLLWRKPPVLALAALPGTALGRLGERSTASSAAAWAAAGAAVRTPHCAPLPPWPGRRLDEIASEVDRECAWLVTNGVLPTDLVTGNRRVAEARSGRGHRYSRTPTSTST